MNSAEEFSAIAALSEMDIARQVQEQMLVAHYQGWHDGLAHKDRPPRCPACRRRSSSASEQREI